MSSQTEKPKPKGKRREEQLYEPILNALKMIFEQYVEKMSNLRKSLWEHLLTILKVMFI